MSSRSGNVPDFPDDRTSQATKTPRIGGEEMSGFSEALRLAVPRILDLHPTRAAVVGNVFSRSPLGRNGSYNEGRKLDRHRTSARPG